MRINLERCEQILPNLETVHPKEVSNLHTFAKPERARILKSWGP